MSREENDVEAIAAAITAKGAVCGACGQPWTGEPCGQADNGWQHQVCYPLAPSAPEDAVVHVHHHPDNDRSSEAVQKLVAAAARRMREAPDILQTLSPGAWKAIDRFAQQLDRLNRGPEVSDDSFRGSLRDLIEALMGRPE